MRRSRNGGPPRPDRRWPSPRADLRYTAELVASSELAAVIDACYPLERIADAYRHVDAGHKKGNVIVTMTGPAGSGPGPAGRGGR